MLKIIFATILFFITTACKQQLGNLNQTHISDVVNHKILDAAGVKTPTLPPRQYDPALEGFIGEFIKDAQDRGVQISAQSIAKLRQVIFVEELTSKAEPSVIAACSRYYLEEKSISGKKMRLKWTIIEVLRKESEAFTENNRIRLRELMYHELFHCLMNKAHLPEGIDGIMSPSFAKGDKRAFKDWKGLVDDMFSKKFIDMIPDTD